MGRHLDHREYMRHRFYILRRLLDEEGVAQVQSHAGRRGQASTGISSEYGELSTTRRYLAMDLYPNISSYSLVSTVCRKYTI